MEKLIEEAREKEFDDMDMQYEELRAEAIEAETEYLSAKNILDNFKNKVDEAKEKIKALEAKGIEFSLINIKHTERKGNVDMKELQRKFELIDSDIDSVRKEPIKVVTITVKK